jgi:hypothetical protein
MVTKAQQNDDGTVSDPVTTETQRGHANYEKEQQEAQKKREAKRKDDPTGTKFWLNQVKQTFLGQPPVEKKAKGGMIKSSASKRADGCAIRGKTRA